MNKLNLFLALIICVGIACGCKFGSEVSTRSSDKRAGKNKPTNTGKTQRKQNGSNSGDESEEESNDSDETSETSDERTSSTGGGDVSAIVGKWVWARTGSSTERNGVNVGTNGSRFTYEFFDDGSVEYTGVMKIMQGGCSTLLTTLDKGQASLDGDMLTIDYEPGSLDYNDSCSKQYRKEIPAKTETSKIEFKESSTGQRLLCFEGDQETCFSPAE